MKEIGQMEFEKAMEYFTMQMGQCMKDFGKIIWSKVLHFSQIRMEKYLIFFLIRTECWKVDLKCLSRKATKKYQIRKKFNLTHFHKVFKSIICLLLLLQTLKLYLIFFSGITLNSKLGIKDYQTFMISNLSTVSV